MNAVDADLLIPDAWLEIFHAAREGRLSDIEFAQLERALLTEADVRRSYISYMALVAGVAQAVQPNVGGATRLPALAEAKEILAAGHGAIEARDAGVLRSKTGRTILEPDGGLPAPANAPATVAALVRHRRGSAQSIRRRARREYWPVWLAMPFMLAAAALLFQHSDLGPMNVSPVAEVRAMADCRWEQGGDGLHIGSVLSQGQRLSLLAGTAKLHFLSGTSVVVEGPSIFELVDKSSLRLTRGTVAVRAMGPLKDFAILTPDASIVDLGTSFGVHFSDGRRTEVEVFEGAVEVASNGREAANHVLELGDAARVSRNSSEMIGSEEDQFGNVLETLWGDMRASSAQQDGMEGDGAVVATFADGATAGSVDTFKGSMRGRGWVTPWLACGNPVREIGSNDPLSSIHPDYLRLEFRNSPLRTIAREYGSVPGFDPAKPHVISWQWRYDGTSDDFGRCYKDRIHFFGNHFYRKSSWFDNTWLIGVVGDHERVGRFRQMIPGNWYVFDGFKGDSFESSHMVDTGLRFKRGVIYSFAIVVYPDKGIYDVVIRDDETTYTKVGLGFRNRNATPGHVAHFGLTTLNPHSDAAFSIDSIRIEPLRD